MNNPLIEFDKLSTHCSPIDGCSSQGEEVDKDLKKAVEQLQKAADKGNSEAQNKLGLHYYFYAKDFEKAFYWFQKAAEAGHKDAQDNIGF